VDMIYRDSDCFPLFTISASLCFKCRLINVNEEWLEKASVERIVKVALHEVRHAYQVDFVNSEELTFDNDNEVLDWYIEFKEIEDGYVLDDVESYKRRKTEIDAEAFANTQYNSIFNKI